MRFLPSDNPATNTNAGPVRGSFEGWSGAVREAVVFAGLSDPGRTRLALQTTADRDAIAVTAMIDALGQMDPDRRGVTTAEIVDQVCKPTDPAPLRVDPPTGAGRIAPAAPPSGP